jgi:hypothetical protein
MICRVWVSPAACGGRRFSVALTETTPLARLSIDTPSNQVGPLQANFPSPFELVDVPAFCQVLCPLFLQNVPAWSETMITKNI